MDGVYFFCNCFLLCFVNDSFVVICKFFFVIDFGGEGEVIFKLCGGLLVFYWVLVY